ncbi:MAG: hypothetical protein ONB17_10945 [candidate division KSB1 bacterium]|nr:hypothetical protein [candidate division KSB1 bacterium]MDZ7384684.1 hypothetical protein [candidate division KSB1 bacterium]MDZ7392253.1 hypothetical protein [candidate division KSB1 bacterium]MDZ7412616.1 hypothetical protein [candidate division KSB1 bacterium]
MPLIRRRWAPREADEWSREDWFAILLSALAYVSLVCGLAGSFLLLPWGFVLLAAGVVFTALMYLIIDPKLRVISTEYEKKQKEHLTQLERIQRWEESA